ncbi:MULTISPECIES: hypothetical protein [unclassified Gilliamella]|uniref:hypothetical protein n=1 Tax=unclassified Gilliamella TaxID=2685620 RepID=UPI0004610491|nr:hypothetical protein [Gilliamella apicola]KDN10200.1 hypothetical protein GAPWKB30_1200 [Gilliamella apicola]OCG51667.1 hypothetical protein A9G38_05820 [Gilliamella apicola]OCG60860.1 hypothetical protein A9G37_02890 [Gilliamella apicola]
MIVINYWQKLNKRLIIKTALSHLLLGVIAAGFGLCQNEALPSESDVSHSGIIAITSIVQDHRETAQRKLPTLALSCSPKQHTVVLLITPNYDDLSHSKAIRLSPYNGIRAGPKTTS